MAALRPEASDSVLAVLKERYPESPYTRAVLGHPAPEYAAVEDSIRHLLDAESLPRVRASAIGIAAGAVTVLPDTSLHDQESPKAPEGGGPSERPRR